MDPRPETEAHFLCLHSFVMHARERDFDDCVRYIRRRTACSLDAGQPLGSGPNWVATMLLGRRWQEWEPPRVARSLELLRLYVAAGYVPAAQLLAPVGLEASCSVPPYLSRRRRLPLASALLVENADAAVLLLERGDASANDLREQFAQFVAFERLEPSLLLPGASQLDVCGAYVAQLWADAPFARAAVVKALLEHRIRAVANDTSQDAALDCDARRRRLSI